MKSKSKFLDLLEQTLKEVDNVGGGTSAGTTSTAATPDQVGAKIATSGKAVQKAGQDYDSAVLAAINAKDPNLLKDPQALQKYLTGLLSPTSVTPTE